MEDSNDLMGVAVVGIAGRFPGASNIAEFWNNLRDGKCSATLFSDDELIKAGVDSSLLNNPNYVKAGYVLKDTDSFDASFFGYTPREAECMDPQHRLFLECAWEAFENAGYNAETNAGLIGLYAGCGINNYILKNLIGNSRILDIVGDYELMIDNDKDFLTTRVSYKLNLKGPSINVQSACSTSLVAVCLGFQSLMTYQCDMALCGGVSLVIPRNQGYLYREGMIFSPDGYCRAFDANSNGTVQGEGVGAVILKRLDEALDDGDHIYAVIKGVAVNNDGALKAGFTAPSIDGQAHAIAMAQELAGFPPETISYIEAHGTATQIGDPIEIAALTKVFREKTAKTGFCAVGSVKTNIGHLDAAAGIAGFLKTVLSLKHKEIPASLHFKKPNSKLNLETSPFYINEALAPWKAQDGIPRRAGVSSFGIGGTNAHVVLEEEPSNNHSNISMRNWKVLALSAKNDSSLTNMTQNLKLYIQSNSDLNIADAAFTLQTGRKIFDNRTVVICRDANDVQNYLDNGDSKHVFSSVGALNNQPVVFMFTGQGSQYVGMATDVYREEKVFRDAVDYCSDNLKVHLGLDLRDILYPKDENRNNAELELSKTSIVQPALFVIEYALAQLWMSWGITPQALIGHSIGEYVAACLSGVFSLDDALRLIALRGRIIQSLPPGAMLSVPLSEKDLEPYLDIGLSIAVINGEKLCVVSGETDRIKELEKRLNADDITSRILQTSHAFHSQYMEPACMPFAEEVKKVSLKTPGIPYISNVTGSWIKNEDAIDPLYYSSHIRKPVKFYEGVVKLIEDSYKVFLEVGPGNTLCSLHNRITYNRSISNSCFAIPSLAHPLDKTPDAESLAKALGKLWLCGAAIEWKKYYQNEFRQRTPLTTYAFERKRHWIESKPSSHLAAHNDSEDMSNVTEDIVKKIQKITHIAPQNIIEFRIREIWSEILGIENLSNKDNFFDLGGNSLMATHLITLINKRLGQELKIKDFFFDPTITGLSRLVKIKASGDIKQQHD